LTNLEEGMKEQTEAAQKVGVKGTERVFPFPSPSPFPFPLKDQGDKFGKVGKVHKTLESPVLEMILCKWEW